MGKVEEGLAVISHLVPCQNHTPFPLHLLIAVGSVDHNDFHVRFPRQVSGIAISVSFAGTFDKDK